MIEIKPITTQDNIELLFDNFKAFILEKNKRYGDSALKPLKIFSRTSPEENIRSRLDEKLSRLMNADKLRKNDVADVMGYCALLMIHHDWLDFEDLLD